MKKLLTYLFLSFLTFYTSIVFDLFPIFIRIIFFTSGSIVFCYFLYQSIKTKIFLSIKEEIVKRIFYILFSFTSIIWIFLVFHRYYFLDYTTWDDITYANSLYNLVKTGKFYNTIFEGHALRDHTVFNLALFYPFFKIEPSVLWLSFFRAITSLACPLILIKIGKELNLKGLVLWVAPTLFLFNTFILDFMRETMHPSGFSLPFILLSFLYAIRKDYTKMFIYLVFIVGFKENLPLVWISMSFYLALFQKKYKLASFVFTTGIILGLFLFFIVKSYFLNPDGGLQSASESIKVIDNIENNNIGHLDVFKPFAQIPQKIFLLISILASFAFIPIFSLKSLITALPSLSLSLIAYKPLDGHHLALPMAVFFVCFALSLSKLQKNNFKIRFFEKYKSTIFSVFLFTGIVLNSIYIAYFVKKSFFFQHQKEAKQILNDIEKLKPILNKHPDHKIWVSEKISAYLLEYYLRNMSGEKIMNMINTKNPPKDWTQNPRFIVFPNTKEYHFLYIREKTLKVLQNELKRQIQEGKLQKLEEFKYLNVYKCI